jgi:hypothetical protein
MARKVRVPISAARSRLFELADTVRTSDNTVVVFEQRGERENVALVREARLAYLESLAAEAESREAKTFRLQGSMTTDLSPEELEEALREIRRGWDSPASRARVAVKAAGGHRRR